MKENKLRNKDSNMVSEFILPPMNEWEEADIADENDAIKVISQIKQKYRDQIFIEIYESGRILHAELANRIPISASGLNAVIKKLNEYRIKTIHETKAGKFKFYTLTQEGIDYIENAVLPFLISGKQDEEMVHNLFNLLALYKDKNPDVWINELNDIIKSTQKQDEITVDIKESLGYELLQELGQFYQSDQKKAKRLLELGVAEKEIQKKLLLYFEEKYSQNSVTGWLVLNQWEQQACTEVYQLIDELFISIREEEYFIKTEEYHLKDMEAKEEAVLDKIKADILQAMIKQWPKKKIVDLWVEEKMEIHLALYIAEKYQVLADYFIRKIMCREL